MKLSEVTYLDDNDDFVGEKKLNAISRELGKVFQLKADLIRYTGPGLGTRLPGEMEFTLGVQKNVPPRFNTDSDDYLTFVAIAPAAIRAAFQKQGFTVKVKESQGQHWNGTYTKSFEVSLDEAH